MNVLIIGNGGREHALAWKAAQSSWVNAVFVAPGNGGTALEPKVKNIDLDLSNHNKLIKFAQHKNIGLTIIGPEAPLVAGIVDDFTAAGLKCFGPSQAAAQLEGSKAYCKDFLRKYQIPTAAYETFNNLEAASTYLNQAHFPLVIKADGLAAGKGVVIAQNLETALSAARDMLEANKFGHAGNNIVIDLLCAAAAAAGSQK